MRNPRPYLYVLWQFVLMPNLFLRGELAIDAVHQHI